MYLGKENLGTKKQHVPTVRKMEYTEKNLADIEAVVSKIKTDYPQFSDQQARIWEVISRYRGDAGLSAHAVSYLVSAICSLLEREEDDVRDL